MGGFRGAAAQVAVAGRGCGKQEAVSAPPGNQSAGATQGARARVANAKPPQPGKAERPPPLPPGSRGARPGGTRRREERAGGAEPAAGPGGRGRAAGRAAGRHGGQGAGGSAGLGGERAGGGGRRGRAGPGRGGRSGGRGAGARRGPPGSSAALTAPLPPSSARTRRRARHGQGRPQQAAGQDVLVRVLRADVPRGAQEEAPGLVSQLRRVLAEVLGAVEGEAGGKAAAARPWGRRGSV